MRLPEISIQLTIPIENMIQRLTMLGEPRDKAVTNMGKLLDRIEVRMEEIAGRFDVVDDGS